MKNILLIILGSAYVMFGILIFIRPNFGAKIIAALPWQTKGDSFSKPELVPADQKIVRPSIVRLLGAACIIIGIFICKIFIDNLVK